MVPSSVTGVSLSQDEETFWENSHRLSSEMTATRDFLEATSNEFNQAVIRAKEAVTAQKSARIATKSLQVLEDAWTKYNTAYAQYAAKLKEPATKAEAQGVWLGEG